MVENRVRRYLEKFKILGYNPAVEARTVFTPQDGERVRTNSKHPENPRPETAEKLKARMSENGIDRSLWKNPQTCRHMRGTTQENQLPRFEVVVEWERAWEETEHRIKNMINSRLTIQVETKLPYLLTSK
jgi:hypothetical protein